MRSLTALTTCAAFALMGVAHAQPANAPASPSTGGADDIQSALAAYASLHDDVSELRALRLGQANDLETALDRASRHNRDAVTRGFIAYGAMTAAQAPAFAQGVQDAAAYYGRDAVIWAINADPNYASGLRGAADARRLALNAAAADGARITAVSERYLEMSTGLQSQRWARGVAPQQAARIQRVRSLGAPGGAPIVLASDISPRLAVTPASLSPGSDPTAFGGRRFWDSLRGGPQVVETSAPVTYQWRVNPTRSDAVNRMTSIAALEVLNAADSNAPAISQLMNDQRSRDCLEMAQLQLYQCLSAARFRYENVYCLGQHALADVGQCFADIGQPDGAPMTPIAGVAATGAVATASVRR
jgi:hypothetical protein